MEDADPVVPDDFVDALNDCSQVMYFTELYLVYLILLNFTSSPWATLPTTALGSCTLLNFHSYGYIYKYKHKIYVC
jgi:hypothetical protein